MARPNAADGPGSIGLAPSRPDASRRGGENAIGYVSPGLIYTFGHWTAYAAYSIKNGDSKGNAGLIVLGYAF